MSDAKTADPLATTEIAEKSAYKSSQAVVKFVAVVGALHSALAAFQGPVAQPVRALL